MAKASPQSYQVVKSAITYNGKVANVGDVVPDFPGEDITWLLADGWIVPATAQPDAPEAPVTAPDDAGDTSAPAESAPVEDAPADTTTEASN